MVAAISAARNGASVTILEQKDRIGKKILSTGNGRCNLTNEAMKEDAFRGDDLSIVHTVLSEFGYQETCHFFEDLGLLLKSRQGYIYPFSDQASAVLDVLRLEISRLSISVKTDIKVHKIEKKEHFKIHTSTGIICADSVVLATGGMAAPVLGSDGSGYTLAKDMGHRISTVVPALVALQSKERLFQQLSGIRVQAKVSLYVEDVFTADDTGELQLANYGISGIPVFQISRFASKALKQGKSTVVKIDFMPTMGDDEFYSYMKHRQDTQGHKRAEDFCVGVLHKKLGNVLLKQAGIQADTLMSDIKEKAFLRFLELCKHFRTEIHSTNSFEQAQVCAGGVKTTEINPLTMESKKVSGLYISGELLDIDGICGGYNLQWAWSTGYIAGQHAAKGN